MKILVLVVGVVVFIAALVVILGWLAPKDHESTVSRSYKAAPEKVFSIINDFGKYPEWRTGVTKVEVEPGGGRFIEHSQNGKIPYKVVDKQPSTRLVNEIDDSSLPFAGAWTFEISPVPAGSELRITERGSVSNPIFRFFSRYIFSPEKTIRTYLNDLAKRIESGP